MNCPNCGSKYKQKMPQIGKHMNSKCVFCYTVFGIKNSKDCCVYCSYSNKLCPEAQKINTKNK
ncbi:GDCCVxC domain-containing (seleno)protein [Maribacter sp. ACAM166]|uniref:GDCCVxC domain-containing (seleno)protein n=1 Tax=Maribacter sp. ACAM166 TaxID=2508996 RepID=UPI00397749CF